ARAGIHMRAPCRRYNHAHRQTRPQRNRPGRTRPNGQDLLSSLTQEFRLFRYSPQAIQKGRKYVFGLFVLPTKPAARLPTLSCEFFVNPLTLLGASVTFIAFAKQQLQGMHALIDAKQIPVEKNEDFFRQAAELEHTLGDQTYARSVQRYGSARKSLVVIACAILAVALLIFGLSMFGPTSHVFKDMTDRLMSDFTLFA